MPALVLHAGLHKTASTSIQAFLMGSRDRLVREGIYVPLAGSFYHYPGHHNLAWEAREDVRFDASFGGLSDALAECRQSQCQTAVISSEDLIYLGQYPDRVAWVEKTIRSAGWEPRWLAFYREPISAARSLYRELLKHGLTCSERRFMAMAARDRRIRTHGDWVFDLDYGRLSRQWEALGIKLELHDYDAAATGPGVLRTFANLIGCSPAMQEIADCQPRYNVTPRPEDPRSAAASATEPVVRHQ